MAEDTDDSDSMAVDQPSNLNISASDEAASMMSNENNNLLMQQLAYLKSCGISVQLSPMAAKQQKQHQINASQQHLSTVQLSVQDLCAHLATENESKTAKRKKFKNVASTQEVKKKREDKEQNLDNSPLSNNRFAILSNLVSDATEINDTTGKTYGTKNINSNAGNKNQLQNETTIGKKRFCPPIVLYNVNVSELVRQFKEKFPSIEIKIINSSYNKSKLYIKDYDAYKEMMEYLKKEQINSHSYTPDEDKQVSLILRGLHHFMQADEIKAELDEKSPNVIHTVKVFTSPRMMKNGIKSNLFLVTLWPGKNITDVANIKVIAYQKISWEKPKSFTKEVQCKKCQRWGHLAKNCNNVYQCVKCNVAHDPGKCDLNKEGDSQAYCVNCKEWGHPANYRGCLIYKKFLELKNRNIFKSNIQNNSHSKSSNSFVKNGVSYAEKLRSGGSFHAANKAGNSKLVNDFFLAAKDILEYQQVSIDEKIEHFLKNIKIMSVEEKRAECLKILELLDAR